MSRLPWRPVRHKHDGIALAAYLRLVREERSQLPAADLDEEIERIRASWATWPAEQRCGS